MLHTAHERHQSAAAKRAACQFQQLHGLYHHELPLSPLLAPLPHAPDEPCNCTVSYCQLMGSVGLGSPSIVRASTASSSLFLRCLPALCCAAASSLFLFTA